MNKHSDDITVRASAPLQEYRTLLRHLLRLWLSLPKGRAVPHPSEVSEGARLLSELVRGRVRKRLNA